MDGRNHEINLEKEFANSTSLHGIARVVNNTRVTLKLTWLSIMLSCLGVCVYQISDRFSDYLMYKANTAISVEYQSNLDFPAVTICNFNRYRKSQVLQEEHDYVKYILSTSDYGSDANPSEAAPPDFLQTENPSMNFNFTEFTRRAGFSISAALGECKWRGQQCSAENFTHVFTPSGNCWTFNSDLNPSILQASQAGQGNGLTVLVNIEQDEYTANSFFEAGLKVVIHDQHTPPLMEASLAIAPGVHAFVGVRRQQYINLEKPHGKCDSSKTLKRFKNYTLEACTIDCLTEKIVQMCECRPVGYPGDETECSPFQEKNCVNEVIVQLHNDNVEDCECTVPCNHTAFRTSLSSAVIPSQNSAKRLLAMILAANQSMSNSTHNNDTAETMLKDLLSGITEQFVKDNFVYLSVYYEELNFQLFKQTKAYTLSALVSDIGGQLGLFVGASFITLAEILSYIGHKVRRCFATKVESEKTATVADESKLEGETNSAF